MKTIGIIDLGSNSMRISVVCISGNLHNTIFMDRRTVKLSENMNTDMYLKTEAIERTVNALEEYKKVFNEFGVERIVAVATAAVRKAKNGGEFIKYVKERTGINIGIIDGKKEAEYDFFAIKYSMDINDCIIIDIGGGSTEIIGIRSGELENYISVPFASRNITEMYLSPENEQTILNAEKEILKIFKNIDWLENFNGVPIVGLGGCLRAIGRADCTGKGIEYKSGYEMDLTSINAFYENIKKMSLPERIKVFGESKGDIILGGLIPFISLVDIVKPKHMLVSDKGVKDGIIYAILKNMI